MTLETYLNKQNIKNIILIMLGTLISAIGINMFIVHANLLSGGMSGVALIVQYTSGFPAGYTMLLLNIPLLILSYKKLNLKFTIFSVIGIASLSMFLILTRSISNILQLKDPLLLCLYGGVLNGTGIGIVLSNYGSTGGLDIISVIIKKKYDNFDIGNIALAVNFVIVSIGAFFFGLTSGLYTLVSMYITSYVIDKTIKGFNRQKMILIVTDKEEEVSDAVMRNLKRGVTFLYGEGAYSKVHKKVLYCVVPLSQLPHLKFIVQNVDESAFISILDVSEVQGRGFKKGLG